MKLALSGQLLARTQSLSTILEIFRSLGVDAIELWPGNLPGGAGPEERERFEQKDIEGTKTLLQSFDMSVACITLGFRVMQGCAEHGPGYGAQALQGAVDAAASLGAPIVNCYLAGLPPQTFADAVRPAAEYAGRFGVTIVLENEAHDDSGVAADVRAIVDAVSSPHFGTQYDPCNYYQAGEEPYPAAYETLKETIRYVHLKGGCRYDPARRPQDHRGGTLRGSDEQYIGYTALPDSAINVDSIVRRLAHDGYAGYVTLEPHVPAERAVDYYRIEVPYVRELLDRYGARKSAPAG